MRSMRAPGGPVVSIDAKDERYRTRGGTPDRNPHHRRQAGRPPQTHRRDAAPGLPQPALRHARSDVLSGVDARPPWSSTDSASPTISSSSGSVARTRAPTARYNIEVASGLGHPRRDARPAEHDDAVTLSEAFHAGGMNRVLGVEHCVDVSTASPTDTTSKSYA
jgi:hypothetical protein